MSRRHKEDTVTTQDAFSNPVFRLGYGTQAPIEATQYPLTRMTDNYALLNALYRGNWVVQNVVDTIPADMLRAWFTLGGDVPPERMDALDRAMRRTQIRERLKKGLCWGRLYGGAAGLLLIRGQEDLSEPLDLSTILPGAFHGLYILDRWSGITPDMELVSDPADPDLDLPAWYSVTNAQGQTVARVHHSRVIRFIGRQPPFLEAAAELYWGESEIEAIYDDLRKHDNVSHNMANLTFRANMDYRKVKNLEQMLSVGGTAQQKRFWDAMQAQSVIRSNFALQLVDMDDEIHNTQFTFTGLKDVYDAMCLDLCGASHIPATKLFGRSPAGLNATGESDLQNYNDYIDGLRESVLRPILERLLPVLQMSAWGEVPDDVDIIFPPLSTPTAAELSKIAKEKTETVLAVFQAGLIDKGTALQELKKQSGETGLFDSIADEEIDAGAGVTWQDVTALKDPLAGIPEEDASPFAYPAVDVLTMDYKGQPMEKNGRFTFGKLSGERRSPLKRPTAGGKMSVTEARRVSSGILTDHPRWRPGETHNYEYGSYKYRIVVKGPGSYTFIHRKRLR